MLFLTLVAAATMNQSSWPGQSSDYHGFTRHDFQVGGLPALVVEPKKVTKGRPWIWRMEFFDHRPEFDIAMLERGYHLAYLNVGNTFGCPSAMDSFGQFYKELTQRHGFHAKAVLEGLSRGGLYAYQFAARNPDKVAVLYGDAPVCDFKTWPYGGPGAQRSEADWKKLIQDYGFPDEKAALAYPFNPVDNLAPLAAAKIPIIHVVGDADEAVPVATNTAVIEKRYREMGGVMEVIHKPGGLHHPHALDDPTPLVEFVRKRWGDSPSSLAATLIAAPNPESRYNLAGWKGLSWLEQFHESVELAVKAKSKFILLGDSITQNWGDPRRQISAGLTAPWKELLAPLIPANMGISGDRVQNVLWRLRSGALKGLEPQTIILQIGTNNLGDDSPADIARGIKAVLEEIRKQSPKARIVLTSLFPNGATPSHPRRMAAHDVNERISKFANKKRILFLDLEKRFLKADGSLDYDLMSEDGIHIKEGGYYVWGKAIIALLGPLS
jgi:lysophospholipase L1-like esterase/pimeloyl-ACP methyl ester carboxylesterase